jgi:hypothetical protein
MSNLTYDTALIYAHRAEPLEGHVVVVMERVGESGERFHSLLSPGDEPLLPGPFANLFGRRPDPYRAFAVDASKCRTLTFSEQVEMSERPFEITLEFSLDYRVSDPQLVVAFRRNDPLGTVRNRVARVVGERVSELPWRDVLHSFHVVSPPVVDRTLTELKVFARDNGISITSLWLKAKVPRETGVWRKRLDVFDDEVTEGIVRVMRGTSDPGEWSGRLDGVRGGLLGSGIHVIGSPNGTFTPAAGAGHAPWALTAGGGGLPGVLDDLLRLTEPITPAITRRSILGSLLHLVAAMVADDSTQDTDEQARCAAEARAAIADVSGFPAERRASLRLLADPGALRERLREFPAAAVPPGPSGM